MHDIATAISPSLQSATAAFPAVRPGRVSSHVALAGYGRVSLEAKVASASPHQLVALLYGRLGQLLVEAEAAAVARDTGRRMKATERALAIVDGLDGTLDEQRGGSVATALSAVYAQLKVRLLSGEAALLAEARVAVAEIGAAWRTIAP